MKLAIYLTWVFIKLKLTANNVTVLSGILCIIGAFLLASGSIWWVILGTTCFIIFPVLDCSDGQVGRYNKKTSIYGHFLDGYMHYVFDAAFFTGLTIGAFSLHFNRFMVVCGFLTVLTPLMYRNILYCGWTIICYERLNAINLKKEVLEGCTGDDCLKVNGIAPGGTFKACKEKFRYWLVLLSTSAFSQSYAPITLLVLSILQIIINVFFNNSLDFRPILIVYIGTIGPVYVIFSLWKRFRTNALEDGYRRLFINSSRIKLPRDYFL
jgi:phosphatidylglycerophosphate synthase